LLRPNTDGHDPATLTHALGARSTHEERRLGIDRQDAIDRIFENFR